MKPATTWYCHACKRARSKFDRTCRRCGGPRGARPRDLGVTAHGPVFVRLDPEEPARRRFYEVALEPEGPWHPSAWRSRQKAAERAADLVAWAVGRLARALAG